MKTDAVIKLRGLCLGDGLPKICVPLMPRDMRELRGEISRLKEAEWDFLEFRADAWEMAEEKEEEETLLKGLSCLRDYTEKPILFTYRTLEEGGERSISDDRYLALNLAASEHGADLIDLQLCRVEGNMRLLSLIRELQARGTLVLGSSHDFEKTPPKAEILRRLLRMEELGFDITKIAVMPRNRMDVCELLTASVEMRERASRPFITMSMGSLGQISRLTGAFTGSAATFGTVGKSSAPGQLESVHLRAILQDLALI